MKDFIPAGQEAGEPVGEGGFRDFVPAEETEAKAKRAEKASKAKKEPKKTSKKKGFAKRKGQK